MYDFDGDYETVYTGETDGRLTGLIEKYNGAANLPQWSGACAKVTGSSDGAKFQSYIKPNDTLRFFRKSLCRSKAMVLIPNYIFKVLKIFCIIIFIYLVKTILSMKCLKMKAKTDAFYSFFKVLAKIISALS